MRPLLHPYLSCQLVIPTIQSQVVPLGDPDFVVHPVGITGRIDGVTPDHLVLIFRGVAIEIIHTERVSNSALVKLFHEVLHILLHLPCHIHVGLAGGF